VTRASAAIAGPMRRAYLGVQDGDTGMTEEILSGDLSIAWLRRVWQTDVSPVRLDPERRKGIRASAAVVRRAAYGDAAVYGVNTGFGKLANQRIAHDDLAALQLNLLRSHAVGVGTPLSGRVTRLLLVLKAASLARGYSGVREEVIDGLLALYNAGLLPIVPSQGSVWRHSRTCACP
jgi:histidine ammonia-lyase